MTTPTFSSRTIAALAVSVGAVTVALAAFAYTRRARRSGANKFNTKNEEEKETKLTQSLFCAASNCATCARNSNILF